MGFGFCSLIILWLLNLFLRYLSFLIDYKDGKILFEVWLNTLALVILAIGFFLSPADFWRLWLLIISGMLAFYSFLYFVLWSFFEIKQTILWKISALVLLLILFLPVAKGKWINISLETGGLLFLLYAFVALILQFWAKSFTKVEFEQSDDDISLEKVLNWVAHAISQRIKPTKVWAGSIWEDVLKFSYSMPSSFKLGLWILTFVGWLLMLGGFVRNIYLGADFNFYLYLLGFALFVVDVLLLFVLKYYYWRYRFLIIVLLNLGIYVFIYAFFAPKLNYVLRSGIAWSFLQVLMYWWLRQVKSKLNIYKEDILVGLIVNTLVVLLNFVLIFLILKFPIIVKLSGGLLYLWLYGFLSYYLLKMLNEEIFVSDEDISEDFVLKEDWFNF